MGMRKLNILMQCLALSFPFFLSLASPTNAETKIVAWNVSQKLKDATPERKLKLQSLDKRFSPDVLVLVEVISLEQVRSIATDLGWPKYYLAVSNWHSQSLDSAVISKIPIVGVLEIDASIDGTIPVYTQGGEDLSIPITEIKMDTRGVPGINPVKGTDRGSMQVDLENGLTLFPVHLKSSANDKCKAAFSARSNLKSLGIELPQLEKVIEFGFEKATAAHLLNAVKRERVLAAVKIAADKAALAGRDVIIAGDFNTSYEEGKAGISFDDCELQNFTCEKGPFPKDACIGDGFDDTLGILTHGLVGERKWSVLTKDLGRTFKGKVFSDNAIDHFAVPLEQVAKYKDVQKGEKLYGSDHYPIVITYSEN